MQVVFATVSKKVNSTLRFSGGTTYDCVLKDGCSVVRPRISLKWTGSGVPTAYNVAYISDFGRYYFIDDWTFADRQWSASMHSDVLASAKTQIGSASKLIVRSATKFDNAVSDSLYPSKTDAMTYAVNLSGLAFAQQLDYGRFVVGIVGQGNTFAPAGAGYVVLTGAQLQQLISACFTETENLWTGQTSLGTDVGEALAQYGLKFYQSIANPVQFINSVVWIPFTPATSGTTAVKLGLLTTGVSAACLGTPISVQSFRTDSVLPTPITVNSGKWRLMAPYARYTLVCPPFGSFNLDSGQVVENSGIISGSIRVDCMTGQAVLELPDFGIESVAQLGVQIQLSGNSVDYAGQMVSAANTAGGIVGNILSGNIAGAISGGITGVVNTAAATMPQATQGSVGGGLAALNASRYVQTVYYEATEEDIPELGRPYMKIDTVSAHSGFLRCADGHVNAPLTPGELEEIESYLTGGFYYE